MDSSLRSSTSRNNHRSRSLSTTSSSQQHRPSEASAAANSLQLLLQEDPLLQEYRLHETTNEEVAFPYAAALLSSSSASKQQQAADQCLQEVERKLALVESLAVKLSRTRPEAVAGHLLRLHGYDLVEPSQTGDATTTTTTTTLAAIRDRADRLERQADVLDGVAKRVETTLTKAWTRMDTSCRKLERVLILSATLKSILRLQFESAKLMDYDLSDVRDLQRAAASVAVLEDLLANNPELYGIQVVDRMRPRIEGTARQVREAAQVLLKEQYDSSPQTNVASSLSQLGAILQVYFHLGELPVAVWKAVDQQHAKAEAISRELFNAVTFVNLAEQAKKTAKEARLIQKKLKQIRAEAAQKWASDMADVALQVRNLQRVLSRKTDPVTRQVFMDVVAMAATPNAYAEFASKDNSTLFGLFWGRVCHSLAKVLVSVLEQDQGKYAKDASALYPPVRAASIELIGRLQETLPGKLFDDVGSAPFAGILGGSSVLNDDFLDWRAGAQADLSTSNENPQAAADVWTRVSTTESAIAIQSSQRSASSGTPLSVIFQSPEWKALQGNPSSYKGFYPLQEAFLEACTERLCSPLQYMFPENVTLNEDGVAISSGLALLPSKYDIQRFDENIRQELSLAHPRESGGDTTAVSMIAQCIVTMIMQFCDRAKNAISGVGENGYVQDDWSMTDSLQHDRKVVAIMFTLSKYLRSAPEKTFVAPFRPANSPQDSEAAKMCQAALTPALECIERMVRSSVLIPLCRALNRRVADVMARIHYGFYMESTSSLDDDSPAFVQKHLSDLFEVIGQNHLSRFPPEYASYLASNIAAFSVKTFVSNAFLVRPLGENVRLHITQDLTDLELTLEQLLQKYGGGSTSLNKVEGGKPYAELRAVRQMLFWTGLDSKNKSAPEIAKVLLRETWMQDIRPSTVFHFLFSFAPSLLSSPHHTKRVKAEDYVSSLVKLDGSVEEGEDLAWMTVMSCCDSYQQRVSSASASGLDGDARVPQTLIVLGQELMKRRRH